MRNPTRRSKHIGTAKQGRGCNNRLTIPAPYQVAKAFYERLGKYEKLEKLINNHQFIFVIEQTRSYSAHACSVAEVASIVAQIPSSDYGELRLIVFRQPTRKQEILSPVWGRLIYSYEFEGEYYPAIILEAVDYQRELKWPANPSVAEQRELDRLRNDGHVLRRRPRFFTADFQLENVRNTQLYRTLPHEFGHYAHYLQVVARHRTEDEELAQFEARWAAYSKIVQAEKEAYAHKYADKLRQKLLAITSAPAAPVLITDDSSETANNQ